MSFLHLKKYKRHQKENGFAHIIVIIGVFAIIGLVVSSNIIISKKSIDSTKSLNILGEEADEDEASKKAEEEAKEASKKAEEEAKEAQKTQYSGGSKSSEDNLKTSVSNELRNKIQSENGKSETEIETASGQKIKTKVEDDNTTKIEIEHGDLKLKYVFKNGEIRLRAENEQGEEIELEEDELDEIENETEVELEEDGIKIATISEKPILTKDNIATLTDFPLTIDLGTNQLIVTTPIGEKVITVLPDQAVTNLLATNVISKVEQVSDQNIIQELGNLNGIVTLEMRGQEVVYKIKGSKTFKLLGFIPVDTAATTFVSIETGDLIAQEQSLLANIIDLLSP